MKKFKLIMPVLAFVVAITVAFAVPSEIEASSSPEVKAFDFLVDARDVECEACGQVDDECKPNQDGEICKCPGTNDQAFEDRNDCEAFPLKKKP